MRYDEVVKSIADILKEFDSECPVFRNYSPGIGPFGEPQLVREIATRLSKSGITANTRKSPDLEIGMDWALEIKIVRPFGDNGREAENWSQNLLHPYEGNVSLLGDAIKLSIPSAFRHQGLFVIGYEHNPPKISLDPLFLAFELIADHVMGMRLGKRIEERRTHLVHPEHQVVRCVG